MAAIKTHLKLTLDKPGHSLDGIGFNLGCLADDISAGSKVSVIGELSINEWNNIRKPQIFLKDIAINEWQLFDFRGNKQLTAVDSTAANGKRFILSSLMNRIVMLYLF